MRSYVVTAAAAATAASLAAVAIVPGALSGAAGAEKTADKLKVGFVYLGPIGDMGWTYQHEVGRQVLVKDLSAKVETTIKAKIIWVNSWFDPAKEADAAKALLDQGADVIMQHTDSPAAMQIAAARGALAFGQDSDMIKFGPKTQLTSIVDNWAPYY